MYVAGSIEFESRKSGLYHFIFSLPVGPKFTLFACSVKIDLDFLPPGTMLGFLTAEQWRYCRRKGLCFLVLECLLRGFPEHGIASSLLGF